jgi:hypothetical protein
MRTSVVVPDSSFEKRLARSNYLTDEDGVELIARFYASALTAGKIVRASYLRVLLAGVLKELGEKPLLTSKARPSRVPAFDTHADLSAVRKVHRVYYDAVKRGVVTKDIADEKGLPKAERQRRAKERNKRSNFARAALSALRAYIKSGGNVRTLVLPEVTKGQLAAYVGKHKTLVSPESRAVSIETAVARVLEIAESLRAKKRDGEALAVVQSAIAQLSAQVGEWSGDRTTTSPRKAMEKGLPLKTPEGVFWPMAAELGQAEARLAQEQSQT